MKIYGLLTRKGTAAAETMLCEQHMDKEAKKLAKAQAGEDVHPRAPFRDVSANGAAECIICDNVGPENPRADFKD